MKCGWAECTARIPSLVGLDHLGRARTRPRAIQSGSYRSGPKAPAEALLERLGCKPMVLGAPRFDLDGPHQRGDLPCGAPVQAPQQAMEEPSAVSVSTTCRVHDHPRLCARDLNITLTGVNYRAACAFCYDESLHA